MFESIRRPEYTGPNRCFPCTVANVAILAIVGALVSIISPIGATVLLIVGAASILFRGYVIPYTPRVGPVIKRAAKSLPGWDPQASADRDSLAGDDLSKESVIRELLQADVLTADGEELYLSRWFGQSLDAEIDECRDRSLEEFEEWAKTVLPDEEVAEVEAVDDPWTDRYLAITLDSGEQVVLPYPVAIAELSAITALAEVELSPDVQLRAAGSIRGFLEVCPVCDTRLEESRYDGCCGNPRANTERLGLVCPECQAVLYKYPARGDDQESTTS